MRPPGRVSRNGRGRGLVPLAVFLGPLLAGGPPGPILLAHLREAIVVAFLDVIAVPGGLSRLIVGALATEPVHEAAQHGETS